MTSFWCLYCLLGTDFTHCSGVYIADSERVNPGWELPHKKLTENHEGPKIF